MTTQAGATAPTATKFALRRDPAATVAAVQLTSAYDPRTGEPLQDWDLIAAWCGGAHRLYAEGDSGEYSSGIALGRAVAGDGDWIVEAAGRFEVWTTGHLVAHVADPPSNLVQQAAQALFDDDRWRLLGRLYDQPGVPGDCASTVCGGCERCVEAAWEVAACRNFSRYVRQALNARLVTGTTG